VNRSSGSEKIVSHTVWFVYSLLSVVVVLVLVFLLLSYLTVFTSTNEFYFLSLFPLILLLGKGRVSKWLSSG